MSMTFSAVVAVPMFLSLFHRPDYAKFLAPIWIAIYVISEGHFFTMHGSVLSISCIVTAAIVIYSMFLKDSESKGQESHVEYVDILNDDVTMSNSSKSSPNAKADRPTRVRVKRYEGVLNKFGIDNWKHDLSNDKSFFVNVDGNEVWSIGLKDAIEVSGAKIGDRIVFWKETEVRTDKAQILDSNGAVTGYRNLPQEKRRGIWHMEVIG